MNRHWLHRDLATRFSQPVRTAVKRSLLLQAVTIGPATMILDGGHVLQLCVVAAAMWWLMAIIILVRRPRTESKIDLALLRIGYLGALPLSILSVPLWGWLWKLLGINYA